MKTKTKINKVKNKFEDSKIISVNKHYIKKIKCSHYLFSFGIRLKRNQSARGICPIKWISDQKERDEIK